MKIATSIFLLLLITHAAAQSVTPAQRDQLYSALSGSWTGQLEYRDYQSNEHVALPTRLEIKRTTDGRSLDLSYIYDDGPTKTVSETSIITLDPTKQEYTSASPGEKPITYHVDELATGKRGDSWQLKLSGTGHENDHAVDVRITINIDRNLYLFKKETRQPGEDFQFRDAYTLTRRTPPR